MGRKRHISGPITAVVTGASSGLGEATARRLAALPDTRLVLVARRADRLDELAAGLPCEATTVAVDLTEADAPDRIVRHLEEHSLRPNLLVNNAGAAWRAEFGDGGYENVRRTMELNFDAALRLTEALLPGLREAAPSAIVNVASTAGRVSRAGAGAYSASKYALIGWSDALFLEEKPHGVHVGIVMPGFIPTEGFPASELAAKPLTRRLLSTPERAADAIIDAGPGGRAERYVSRPYGLVHVLKAVSPWLVRKLLSSGSAQVMTTKTKGDTEDPGRDNPDVSDPS